MSEPPGPRGGRRRRRREPRIVASYRERFTPRGRWLFWAVVVLAVIGANTRMNQVYLVFAPAAALLLAAAGFAFARRPRVRLECRWPERATAGTPVALPVRVHCEARRQLGDLRLGLTIPLDGRGLLAVEPRDGAYFAAAPGKPSDLGLEIRAERRGRYVFEGPFVARTDPLRVAATRAVRGPEHALLVSPRFFTLEEFTLPVGRRYQPGGIPLSSHTGESLEFLGTREYREGDPVKNIHWRSFARRGKPVVKEYQEEYFCRIALVLDTYLPPRPRPGDLRAFEAAISVLASIADFYSRSDYVVDILAAGPEVYDLSAGRSLAYFENILDVLACLEPCRDPPFERIAPQLFERLARITTVVAVLQDWDPARADLIAGVRAFGTAVRVLIVREGPTAMPFVEGAGALGEATLMTPAEVERRIAACA